MRYFFRLGLLLALANGTLLGVTSCSSDKQEDPQAVTGWFSGTVSPAGSVTKVTATNTAGRVFVANNDVVSGGFVTTNLVPGTYVLSFETTARYLPFGHDTITIVAGKQTNRGLVLPLLRPNIPVNGTMTWTTNGQTHTTNNVVGRVNSLTARELVLTGTDSTSTPISQVNLYLYSDFSGPGNYLVRDGDNSIHYHLLRIGGFDDYETSAADPGTLVVSSYDPVQGTVTGTFGFNAVENTNRQPIAVTNGTFNVRF